jgi:hypothetical protein
MSAGDPDRDIQCRGPRLVFEFHVSPVNQTVSPQHAQYTYSQSQGLQSAEHTGIHRIFNSIVSYVPSSIKLCSLPAFSTLFDTNQRRLIVCFSVASRLRRNLKPSRSISSHRVQFIAANVDQIRVKPADQEYPEGFKVHCGGIRRQDNCLDPSTKLPFLQRQVRLHPGR